MSDIGFDLRMLRKEGEVVAGFHVSQGVFQFTVQHPETGERAQAQMPVIDLNLTFATGRQERISVTPESVMPMIAVLSEWAVKLQGLTQGAPPPETPVNTGIVKP
jgi:hypothetical protein